MIVRKQPDGQLLLIGQTDHSRLVGQIAAHWGNDRFQSPRPFDSVARAAAFHDYGWLSYETAPILLEPSGETPEFRQVPTDERQLSSYQWCIDWMSSIDAYSGLLVGMHRTGLWRGRYDTITHPQMGVRKLGPEIDAFIARNEARQRQEREALDTRQRRTNYHLLQVWDLLGLYFCCQDPSDDYIEPVPCDETKESEGFVRLTMRARGGGRVAFEPFPFARRPLTIQLTYRRLPATTYPDLDAFRRAYFQAAIGLMTFELV